jgi:FKBP-type peptidyl-prolyl cis-trans isomerase FkpA
MSITAVPIQPIEKGSLLKLWGGVGLAVLIAGGLAYAGTMGAAGGGCGAKAFLDEGKGISEPILTATGLRFQTVKAGKGAKPTESDVGLINYKGSFAKDGKEFDANQNVPMPVGGTIPGFSEALKMMQPGGSYRICIPSELAYGAKGAGEGKIPPNSVLLFEVDLIAAMGMAEFQARMQAMEAQRGAQGGGPDGAGAPPQGR